MGYQLNKKLMKLTAYEPITGEFNIRLDANESCYNLSDEIIDKITAELKELDYNRYPDAYAKDVIKAFAEYYNVNFDYVTAGNGSDELISVITSCFLEKGDTIVTLAPDFTMYAFYGRLYELDVKVLEKADDLTVDIDVLIDYCHKSNAKALIFSNPCNPTSLGIEKKDIKRLIKSLNCLIILDEAYMDFWTESLMDEIADYDNVIILKTCSKAVGLASIRLGFAVAGEKITNALKAAKSPYNTDSISQIIGKIIFENKEYLNQRQKQLISNTKILFEEINKLHEEFDVFEKIYNTKTNFVFIKTEYADEIFEYLVENSIAIRKFKGFLRISTGTNEEIKELISALKIKLIQIKAGEKNES